jgi:hypothetical protein
MWNCFLLFCWSGIKETPLNQIVISYCVNVTSICYNVHCCELIVKMLIVQYSCFLISNVNVYIFLIMSRIVTISSLCRKGLQFFEHSFTCWSTVQIIYIREDRWLSLINVLELLDTSKVSNQQGQNITIMKQFHNNVYFVTYRTQNRLPYSYSN